MFQLYLHINNFSSVFNSSLWPWFWLQPVQHWFLVGGHKLTVTFSCIHCNTDFWSTIYVLTSQRFMWPDAFNLSSPVLGLGRIIIINNWYLLLFLDICVRFKQGTGFGGFPIQTFKKIYYIFILTWLLWLFWFYP